MNIHKLLDDLTVYTALVMLARTRYFSDDASSAGMAEHLAAVDLAVPPIEGEGMYPVQGQALVGPVEPAFRVAQWLGADHPTVLYHHGTSENPYDTSFRFIFPVRKVEIPANLIVLRAPFNASFREFAQSLPRFENYVAMMATSAVLIEALVDQLHAQGSGQVVVTGTSLGGFIANLHHTHYGTADAYAPLLAGAAMDAVLLDSVYSKLIAIPEGQSDESIRRALNFEEAYARADRSIAYPLLARYDQYIVYERQAPCYGDCAMTVLPRGHATGALATTRLREHVLAAAGL